MNRSTVIIIAVIIALFALIVFLFSRGEIQLLNPIFLTVEKPEAEEEEEMATTTVEAGGVANETRTSGDNATGNASAPNAPANAVYLGEVESGNIVTVPSATLSRPGYIVLYNINSNGEGRVIGNSGLLSASTHFNVKIQLDRIVADKQALVATLHEDDGDQKFEYPESDGYLTNGGVLVNDIDVVGITRNSQESRTLELQVEAYVENNF